MSREVRDLAEKPRFMISTADAKRFAELFVNGPKAGDWAETAKLAGLPYPPSRGSKRIQEALEALGSPIMPPDALKMQSPPESAVSYVTIPTTTPPEDASREEWCAEAKKLKQTMLDGANGTLKITAAQARMIQHVMDRCYGIVGKQAQDIEPGIVVLPTIGTGADMQVCPQCLEAHKSHLKVPNVSTPPISESH